MKPALQAHWYLGVALATVGWSTATAEPEFLTSAAQVRGLTLPQAERGVPATLSGVITYAEADAGMAFLQDDSGGVMLTAAPAVLTKLRPSIAVAIEGQTAKGNFSPVILVTNEASVRVLGDAALPSPRHLGIEELQRGLYDGQWIEMRGVVRLAEVRPFAGPRPTASEPARSYYRLLLEINTAHGRYTAIIPWEAGRAPPAGLTDSAVRIEGVLGSIVNARGQWVGLLVYVPTLDNIHVERPPSSDPFQVPPRGLSELFTFSPEKRAEQRVRVSGTLLVDQPNYYGFLRTSEGTIELHGHFPPTFKRGDYVEASGYPTLQNKRVFLDDCLLRLLRGGQTVEPVETTVAICLESDLHAELVRIRGELLQNTKRQDEALLILNCDGQVVEATVSQTRLGAETSRIARLKPNSLLELEGVAQIVTSMQPSGYVRPSGFRLLLGRPGDIRLLRAPPWWTPQRLLGLVGALMAVLGLVAVWVVLLRRQVRQQTRIIKDKIEREAVWRDRSRIAQDIHDDLGASLTQVGFLSQRIQTAREHPKEAAALADRVVEVSRSTVRALDEIVWAVNPRHDSLQSLADYLVKLASEQLSLTHINCLLDIPTVLPEVGLRAEIRHNLALAVKEALHNVVKHSRARTLNLALRFEADQVEINIRDDGIGFVRAANSHQRNGLANIERRLTEIGGSCQIETGPGQGASVRLCVLITPLRTEARP